MGCMVETELRSSNLPSYLYCETHLAGVKTCQGGVGHGLSSLDSSRINGEVDALDVNKAQVFMDTAWLALTTLRLMINLML